MSMSKARMARTDLRTLLAEHTTDTIECVRMAVRAGQINGHSYYTETCCIIGHLAQLTDRTIDDIKGGGETTHPIETWIMDVWPGQTPHDSEALRLVDAWLTEVLDERGRRECEQWRQIQTALTAAGALSIDLPSAEEVLA